MILAQADIGNRNEVELDRAWLNALRGATLTRLAPGWLHATGSSFGLRPTIKADVAVCFCALKSRMTNDSPAPAFTVTWGYIGELHGQRDIHSF